MSTDADDTRTALLFGTDLDYVISHIDTFTPGLDPEDDPGLLSETELAVYRAMCDLKDAIRIRQAVQAGPGDVRYCGVDRNGNRACGAELGLPDCQAHARWDAQVPA